MTPGGTGRLWAYDERSAVPITLQPPERRWGSERMYTHVAADNEVAFRLYTNCGFKQYSVDSKFESALDLGKLVLLQATADLADHVEH